MNQVVGFRKYEKGFNPKWLEDKKNINASKKLAEFYANLFSHLFFNADISEEIMIRFMPKIALEECLDKRIISNLTFLLNYDNHVLRNQGFDLTSFNQKFGNPKCVVAIPLRSLSQWFNTYSWVKLFVSGTLENALIFVVPRSGIILREHRMYDNSFRLFVDGASQDKIYNQHKKYFESTDFYNKKFFKNQKSMLEAWIPYRVNLKKFILVKR